MKTGSVRICRFFFENARGRIVYNNLRSCDEIPECEKTSFRVEKKFSLSPGNDQPLSKIETLNIRTRDCK